MAVNVSLRVSFLWIRTELAQLSGIAAILRFPMPELEDENEDDADDDDDSDS